MKPTVLIISANTFLGGTEKVILSQIQNAKDVRYVVGFLKTEGPLVDEIRKTGVPVWTPKRSFRFSRPLSWRQELESLTLFCKQENVKLILSHLSYAQVFGSMLSQTLAIPNCWFQHGPVGGWLDWIVQFTPTKRIFYNSEITQRLHQKLMRNTRIPSEVVYIPVDTLKKVTTQSLRANLALTTEDFLFVQAGRLQEWKGQAGVLEAFIPLAQRYPQAHLAFVGSSDIGSHQYEENLKKRVHSSGLGKQIHFSGFQTDISDILSSADTVICNSQLPEPFGLIIAEAFQEGVPLICTCESGAAEILPVEKRQLSESIEAEYQKGHQQHIAKVLPEKLRTAVWTQNFEKKILSLLSKSAHAISEDLGQ